MYVLMSNGLMDLFDHNIILVLPKLSHYSDSVEGTLRNNIKDQIKDHQAL